MLKTKGNIFYFCFLCMYIITFTKDLSGEIRTISQNTDLKKINVAFDTNVLKPRQRNQLVP